MNCKIIINKDHEEEVLIYAHERSKFVDETEQLVSGNTFGPVGYKDREVVMLNLFDVICFLTEDNKVYAMTDNEKLLMKIRLYTLEEKLPENFVRINQSCLANIKKIKRFDASFSGTLLVRFKNGHTDYVSRRQLKKVKERLGL